MRIDPVHTGFRNSRAMRIARANSYSTTSCAKMAYVDALAVLTVLLLFNCTRLRLKHERDRRRRENMRLRRYAERRRIVLRRRRIRR